MTIDGEDGPFAQQRKKGTGRGTSGKTDTLELYRIVDYENEEDSERDGLKHALPLVVDKLKQRLMAYKGFLKEKEILQFVQDHFHCPDIGRILADPYRPLFESCKKNFTRMDIERFLRDKGHDQEIDEMSVEMKKLEDEWDRFLLDVDRRFVEHWNDGNGRCSRFSIRPDSITLVDCDTERPTTLKSCLNPRMGRYTLFIIMRFFE